MAVLEPHDTRRSVPPDPGELGPLSRGRAASGVERTGPRWAAAVRARGWGCQSVVTVGQEWSPSAQGSPTSAAE